MVRFLRRVLVFVKKQVPGFFVAQVQGVDDLKHQSVARLSAIMQNVVQRHAVSLAAGS